jgi:hypothetical protein
VQEPVSHLKSYLHGNHDIASHSVPSQILMLPPSSPNFGYAERLPYIKPTTQPFVDPAGAAKNAHLSTRFGHVKCLPFEPALLLPTHRSVPNPLRALRPSPRLACHYATVCRRPSTTLNPKLHTSHSLQNTLPLRCPAFDSHHVVSGHLPAPRLSGSAARTVP